MDNIQIEPLHPEFGARITGFDLARVLAPEELRHLTRLVDDYSLIALPDQTLSDEIQLSLTRQLGEPEAEHVTLGKTGRMVYFGTVGNIDEDGRKRGNTHVTTRYQRGNNLWHSDSSFREIPSYVSIMFPYEVPAEGGATEFVSERSAYRRLGEDQCRVLENREVIHDYVFSRTQTAPVDLNHAASLPPVKHPLIRKNPSNGLKNLYIGSHARSVIGMGGIESRTLLDQLLVGATRQESIYAHQWKSAEVVIWDNRCLLHRGTYYDADRWRRYMRQTRVMGTHRGRL